MPQYQKYTIKTILLTLTFTLSIFGILSKVEVVHAGTTPPVTIVTQTPNTPDGNNEWYVSPIRFDLQSTDLNSGVESINYRIDGGSWQTVSFSDTLNLVQNPSFETSGATTTGIALWEATLEDVNTIHSQDPVTFAPNFASASAKIVTTSPSGIWHGVNNRTTFAVAYAYENMTASLWLKTQDVTENAYFRIYSLADDGFGGEVVTLIATSAALTGTNDWTLLNVSFSALPEAVTGVYLDIGLEGPGTIWADAATINSSTQTAEVSVTIATDNANHTFEYYAKDQANNTEYSSCIAPKANCVEFKIDTTNPGNWGQSGAIRIKGLGSNDHTLYVFTNVDDITAGLDVSESSAYQYKVDEETEFGTYPDLLSCLGTWQVGNWANLDEGPSSDGDNTAYLQTQQTDLCNSNWKICKTVKFKAVDMAGNNSIKDFCINGPWIKIRGEATVRADYYIDMVAEPAGNNTDGIIEIGNSTANFFTSSPGWKVIHSPIPPLYNYQTFYNLVTQNKSTFTGDLPTSSEVYEISGDFTITKQELPTDYNTATFSQVYFVNGSLTIEDNIDIDETSAVLFIVNGDVNIAKMVDLVDVGIIAEGNIYTAYDISLGEGTKTLEIRGLMHADRIILQRTLQGTNNEDTPSEDFIYEAKYLIKLKEFFGKNTVSWRAVE